MEKKLAMKELELKKIKNSQGKNDDKQWSKKKIRDYIKQVNDKLKNANKLAEASIYGKEKCETDSQQASIKAKA